MNPTSCLNAGTEANRESKYEQGQGGSGTGSGTGTGTGSGAGGGVASYIPGEALELSCEKSRHMPCLSSVTVLKCLHGVASKVLAWGGFQYCQ